MARHKEEQRKTYSTALLAELHKLPRSAGNPVISWAKVISEDMRWVLHEGGVSLEMLRAMRRHNTHNLYLFDEIAAGKSPMKIRDERTADIVLTRSGNAVLRGQLVNDGKVRRNLKRAGWSVQRA